MAGFTSIQGLSMEVCRNIVDPRFKYREKHCARAFLHLLDVATCMVRSCLIYVTVLADMWDVAPTIVPAEYAG